MKIGLNIGMGGESFDTQVAMTVAAEDAGLNSVWFAQHVGYDAMMLAADAARRTARIGVATGVTPIYPRHPIAVASQAHSARAVAGERFRLGIGVSHRPFTENIHGLRYTSPARYLREYVTVVRQLLDDRRSHFEGEFFSVDCDLEVEDRGAVPVFVAAMGALTLTVCGELADGVVTALAGPRMIAEHVVPRLAEASARAGRPMPAVVSTVPALVTSDRAGARERAGHFFEHTRRLDAYNEALLREGVDDPVDIAPIGSESEVRDILGRYREAGVTEFLISSFGSEADRRRTMEVLGSAPA